MLEIEDISTIPTLTLRRGKNRVSLEQENHVSLFRFVQVAVTTSTASTVAIMGCRRWWLW